MNIIRFFWWMTMQEKDIHEDNIKCLKKALSESHFAIPEYEIYVSCRDFIKSVTRCFACTNYRSSWHALKYSECHSLVDRKTKTGIEQRNDTHTKNRALNRTRFESSETKRIESNSITDDRNNSINSSSNINNDKVLNIVNKTENIKHKTNPQWSSHRDPDFLI